MNWDIQLRIEEKCYTFIQKFLFLININIYKKMQNK